MKRLAYALAGVIALAAVLLVAFGPALVDTPAVRAEIQRRLSAAVDGEVAWDSLKIALFPAPPVFDRRTAVALDSRPAT